MTSALFGNDDLEKALAEQEAERQRLEAEQEALEAKEAKEKEIAGQETVRLRRAGTGGGTTSELSNTLG